MTYVGQPVKRFEDAPLVTGQGRFLDDVPLPGMLYSAVLRSDYAHARIRSIDVSAARDLPGVVEVLTASDIAGTLEDIPSRPMAGEQMIQEMNPPTHPVLAKDKVCYAGQAVAIVVAQDHYIAAEAIELISVDYEPLPPIMDPDEAVKPECPVIHPELGANVSIRLKTEGGDVAAAFEVSSPYRCGSSKAWPNTCRSAAMTHSPRCGFETPSAGTRCPRFTR